jgi:hypothetical protein
VILFDAAGLWHSGTFSYTPAARLALTVHYGTRAVDGRPVSGGCPA